MNVRTFGTVRSHATNITLLLVPFPSAMMLRTQLRKSAARAGRYPKPNVVRTFYMTPSKRAEVELTVGR